MLRSFASRISSAATPLPTLGWPRPSCSEANISSASTAASRKLLGLGQFTLLVGETYRSTSERWRAARRLQSRCERQA